MFDAETYPHIETLVEHVLHSWPRHAKYIQKSFADRTAAELTASNRFAKAIIRMAETVPGGMATLCDDYQFTSEKILLPEELHFRRSGEYRLKSFEEADRECYSDPVLMGRYMNGLAVSDVLWSNHAGTVAAFLNDYLPSVPSNARHLEVGPGHGFFLYFAALDPKVSSLTGWDVSATSIKHTRHVLQALGVEKTVDLKVQDLLAAGSPASGSQFDSIVISEVLEHLENPHAALRSLSEWLSPEGKIWINVPLNCPAPDHIYLLRNLEEARALVQDCGLQIERHDAFPMTGATLESATRKKQTISCVITASKADGQSEGVYRGTR